LCKPYANRRQTGAIRSCRRERDFVRFRVAARGQNAWQFLHRTGEVMQSAVRIARGQRRCRVAGQFLQGSQVDARLAAQGQVRVPERVKVGMFRTVWPVDDIGNPCRLQIDPQHVGGDLGQPPGQMALPAGLPTM
jgi:hypothetical protein